MDQQLLDLVGDKKATEDQPESVRLVFIADNEEAGDIQVILNKKEHPYKLKEIEALFGPEQPPGAHRKDLTNPYFDSVFHGIESAVLSYYHDNPGLTDG